MQHQCYSIQRNCAHDVDLQAAMLEGWHQEYQQLSKGRFLGSVALANHGDVSIVQECTNQSLHQVLAPPESHVIFGQVLHCDSPVHLDSKPLEQAQWMVLEGGRQYDLCTQGATKLLGIAFRREALIDRMTDEDTHLLGRAIQGKVIDLAPHLALLIGQFAAVLSNILETSGERWPEHVHSNVLQDLAIGNFRLALAACDADCLKESARSAARQATIVRQAIHFMRSNLATELSVTDICAAAHVSQRTLQTYFENCLKISPQQYLKALRLNVARRLLMQGGTSAGGSGIRAETIADIAAECGFSHPSRFASDFRLLFGDLPSTLFHLHFPKHENIAAPV